MTPELQELLDENPDLKITFVKPTVSQIVGSLIECLNCSDIYTAMALSLIPDKRYEVVLDHAFHGLSEETFNEVLDHLMYFDFSKLKISTYKSLLLRIPATTYQYGRIKGNMMFELCRHMSYEKALTHLGIKDV